MKARTLEAAELKMTDLASRKIMALLNFRRSLLDERYEDCSRWILDAKGYGASHGEISGIVKDPWGSLKTIEGN